MWMVALLACGGPPACDYGGAGVLVLDDARAVPRVLLAKRCGDGTWSDFGGGHEPEDRCRPAATAAREFTEETRGLFDQTDLLAALERPALEGRSWLARFPETGDTVADFAASMAGTPCTTSRATTEVSELRWVEVDQVESMPLEPRFRERFRAVLALESSTIGRAKSP